MLTPPSTARPAPPLTTGLLHQPGGPWIPRSPVCSQRVPHRATAHTFPLGPLSTPQRASLPSQTPLQSLQPQARLLTPPRTPRPPPVPSRRGSHWLPEVLHHHLCPEALFHPGSQSEVRIRDQRVKGPGAQTPGPAPRSIPTPRPDPLTVSPLVPRGPGGPMAAAESPLSPFDPASPASPFSPRSPRPPGRPCRREGDREWRGFRGQAGASSQGRGGPRGQGRGELRA